MNPKRPPQKRTSMLRFSLFWSVVALVLLVVYAACTPAQQPLHEVPMVTGRVSPTGVQAILGTSDLGVGSNRIGFVLQTTQELVSVSEATVSTLYYPSDNSEGELRETATATFRLWPYGTRGMYTTQVSFDRPGRWGLDIHVQGTNGSDQQASLLFDVEETAATPAVGSPAPLSMSKTVRDVADLSELTTGFTIDPDLYQMTIAEAVGTNRPTVVVLTSPAYCINAVCGPQDEVLRELKDAYKGQANFIHVDIYDNPTEIAGDLANARVSTTAVEWNLPSIEWTFVIDRLGIIAAKFEAFATFDELETALLGVLSS